MGKKTGRLLFTDLFASFRGGFGACACSVPSAMVATKNATARRVAEPCNAFQGRTDGNAKHCYSVLHVVQLRSAEPKKHAGLGRHDEEALGEVEGAALLFAPRAHAHCSAPVAASNRPTSPAPVPK